MSLAVSCVRVLWITVRGLSGLSPEVESSVVID